MTDYCIKVGGSLLKQPRIVREALQAIADSGVKSIVVTGSGPFIYMANSVLHSAGASPERDEGLGLLSLSRSLSAHLLAALVPAGVVVATLTEAGQAHESGLVPVVDVGRLFGSRDEQACGTDFHASMLCRDSGIRELVICTDVDGVMDAAGKLIEQMTAKELLSMGRTCVDAGVGDLLEQYEVRCTVLNGFFPERLRSVLTGSLPVVGTRIV